jgi:LmbE family N-acetylglucosaminyl deacetylase
MASLEPDSHGWVIIAHPDDETLWAGGLILSHPQVHWTILALTRESDPDRGPKFFRVIKELNATGRMADLDDSPQQKPLTDANVEETILELLPGHRFELVLTHGPQGEYTRHRRHEEVSRAVGKLWSNGDLPAGELWLFAYSDKGGQELPRADPNAHLHFDFPDEVWDNKYRLITETYGFSAASWEARVAPRVEGFWRFSSPANLAQWLEGGT